MEHLNQTLFAFFSLFNYQYPSPFTFLPLQYDEDNARSAMCAGARASGQANRPIYRPMQGFED